MNPIRPEATPFTETQKLLLNLLQALQVFTSPGTSSVQPSFSKYLFTGVPANKPEPRFRHQVQILAQILQKASSDAESIIVNTGKGPKEVEKGMAPDRKMAVEKPSIQAGLERAYPSPGMPSRTENPSVGLGKRPPEAEKTPNRLLEMEKVPPKPEAIRTAHARNLPLRPEERKPSVSSENETSTQDSKGELKSPFPQKNEPGGSAQPKIEPQSKQESFLPKSGSQPKIGPQEASAPSFGSQTKEDSSTSPQGKQTFPNGIPSDIAVSFPRKTPPQISAPIKSLMEQVRLAIQALSTSVYLERPDKAPVNDILRRIKPLIDQLILVVETQDDMPNGSDGSAREIRPLPQSPRKNLFNPELPRFLLKEGGEPPKNQDIPEKRSYRPMARENQPGREKNENTTNASPQPKTVLVPFQPGLPKPNFAIPPEIRNLFPAARDTTEEGEKKNLTQNSEVHELPGAPYTPEKKSLDPQSKKKKKRKGFWTRREEEEEKPSP